MRGMFSSFKSRLNKSNLLNKTTKNPDYFNSSQGEILLDDLGQKFIYEAHRPYVEQLILQDRKMYLDISNQYEELLQDTRRWQEKYIKRKIQVFHSYARPVLTMFPDEFWHEPFLLAFCLDLKKAGFSPLLDILNHTEQPREFMMRGIADSRFVILHGSRSARYKEAFVPAAFIREEIGLSLERLGAAIYADSMDRNFLIGVRLSGGKIEECFPHRCLGGAFDIYEFSDNNQIQKPRASYLCYIFEIMRKMFKACIAEPEAIAELEFMWKKASSLMKIPLGERGLKKEEFDQITRYFRDRKKEEDKNSNEYIFNAFEKIVESSALIVDKDSVISSLIKAQARDTAVWN